VVLQWAQVILNHAHSLLAAATRLLSLANPVQCHQLVAATLLVLSLAHLVLCPLPVAVTRQARTNGRCLQQVAATRQTRTARLPAHVDARTVTPPMSVTHAPCLPVPMAVGLRLPSLSRVDVAVPTQLAKSGRAATPRLDLAP